MGACEAGTPVPVEATLKYHTGEFGVLTQIRKPDRRPCMVGSLTGAVSSQSVTEEREGTLSPVGNRAFECKGIRVLDCEADKPGRCESRP